MSCSYWIEVMHKSLTMIRKKEPPKALTCQNIQISYWINEHHKYLRGRLMDLICRGNMGTVGEEAR